jgi:outer membrane protein TolC
MIGNTSAKLGTILILLNLLFVLSIPSSSQNPVLTLSGAVDTGLKNYQTIQAKRNYYNASNSLRQNTKNEYLPNLIASIQQDYGTVNGSFGPLGAVGIAGAGGGLAVASSGPVSSTQNWNAAFGALYLATVNWEFYSFGRVRSKIKMSGAQVNRDSADLMQEKFIHSVRISGSYLNLLVAQRLVEVAQSNLDRIMYVQKAVKARTAGGLNPGVDSTQANSEVSRAKLILIDSRNNEQQVRNQLAQYLKVAPEPFQLDTTLFNRLPSEFVTSLNVSDNPQAKFYKSRLEFSNQTASFLKKSILPGFNFFSVLQTRGSGFATNYTPDFPDRYSKSYTDGVNPTRSNYLLGVSLSWNVMSMTKIRQQVNAQRFVSAAYQNEYDLIETQLRDQLILADQKLENSLQAAKEVPVQYQAARDAYTQKSVLYKNGLTTLVDLQQALYALSRAEADQSLAYINVWQALLQKAAASGDFDLFLKQASPL